MPSVLVAHDTPNAATDYLVVPEHTAPSFHYRVGKAHHLPDFTTVAPAETERSIDIQQPAANEQPVVGSGSCALAYVTEALERDPFRRILILERGDLWLPTHFQNLPLPFKMTYNSTLRFLHGSCPFFGGRSTFWSAWSPRPKPELMRGFPPYLLNAASSEELWKKASALLHVTKASDIEDQVFGVLQKDIDARLSSHINQIPTANTTESAPLSVGRTFATTSVRFNKFSTPGPLLALQERQRRLAHAKKGSPLMIATNVVARQLQVDTDDDNKVNVLRTSRGDLLFPDGKTNVILAAGAIPNTTLLLNSLPEMQSRAGSRITGHFLTHIAARFPIDGTLGKLSDHLEIAANYVAGKDTSGLQYHIQVTALHSPNPEQDAEDAARECPDFAAAATEEQLKGSEKHIVLVCATLGELDEHNPNSWVKPNSQVSDPTTNIKVQITLTDKDKALWTTMDKATYDAIAVMAGAQSGNVEYWAKSPNSDTWGWSKSKPAVEDIRVPGVVHEAATLYMGDRSNAGASVDDHYRPFGSNNVYVTGAALFPSSGSWNPTLTMCGYAQDLARKIVTPRAV
ncbi:hypothetical protein EVG20_g1912 [Dentipellis fragilis]|uniref:Glucose-methanol-choline oxidoreductase C-terminal domain-containing protein n=1 Tax=Dentipellis fragilis TaxID=205917 RepID=A0A4Y9ZBB7_9AGAM|nr:hypothetical protein EVG20_g1912 [Dentipellis fragilis]